MTWDNKRKLLGQVFFNLKEKKDFCRNVKMEWVFLGRQDVGVSFISLVKSVPLVISD